MGRKPNEETYPTDLIFRPSLVPHNLEKLENYSSEAPANYLWEVKKDGRAAMLTQDLARPPRLMRHPDVEDAA